ncbi:MAG: cytochrome c3 family protein, partial [Anaerolineales bacterium]
MLKRIRAALRKFFFPPPGSPRWIMVFPYAVLGILTLSLLVGGAYAWDYTNSPSFCGTTCHTMPPEYAAYQVSPHARIACVDCHIGREFIGNQIFRKAGDVRHIIATTFQTYEFPIRIKNMRPAREICEKCHSPEKFSDDSLRVAQHFNNDKNNTPYSIYLVLKTGGGAKREGLGRGIHWHI